MIVDTDKLTREDLVTILRGRYPNGHPDFIPMCLGEIELHSAKNADYAHSGNPLGNFTRVSAMIQICGGAISRSQVALIYMLKQIDAVMCMLFQNYEGKVEGADAKLQDISVYAKLIRILRREESRTPGC